MENVAPLPTSGQANYTCLEVDLSKNNRSIVENKVVFVLGNGIAFTSFQAYTKVSCAEWKTSPILNSFVLIRSAVGRFLCMVICEELTSSQTPACTYLVIPTLTLHLWVLTHPKWDLEMTGCKSKHVLCANLTCFTLCPTDGTSIKVHTFHIWWLYWIFDICNPSHTNYGFVFRCNLAQGKTCWTSWSLCLWYYYQKTVPLRQSKCVSLHGLTNVCCEKIL